MIFYYYCGDWVVGKTFVREIEADTLTEADKQFQEADGKDPAKDKTVTVTLKKFENL